MPDKSDPNKPGDYEGVAANLGDPIQSGGSAALRQRTAKGSGSREPSVSAGAFWSAVAQRSGAAALDRTDLHLKSHLTKHVLIEPTFDYLFGAPLVEEGAVAGGVEG